MPVPMTLPVPPEPLAYIEVVPVGAVWRMTSTDGLFSGLFRDRTTAVRHARREADWHPGHIVVVHDESLKA